MSRLRLPLLLGLLLGCQPGDPVVARITGQRVSAGDLVVTRAFGLVPFTDAPLPVYFHIVNTGNQPDTLLQVSATGGLPQPMIHGAGMALERDLVVPAQGELRLEPGGRHLMFEPPLPKVMRGDSVELTLKFAHAGSLKLWAWVVEYAEADLVR